VHTARYPQDLDLTNKRVAVIGAGSSAIQVVPTIQPSEQALFFPSWLFSNE
jgi:cation diffusion facilitator CzcD-associated flavoprotein CzcO